MEFENIYVFLFRARDSSDMMFIGHRFIDGTWVRAVRDFAPSIGDKVMTSKSRDDLQSAFEGIKLCVLIRDDNKWEQTRLKLALKFNSFAPLLTRSKRLHRNPSRVIRFT